LRRRLNSNTKDEFSLLLDWRAAGPQKRTPA